MDLLQETLPPLDKIRDEIDQLAESGGKYMEAPHVIEVTLPMLCRLVHEFDTITGIFYDYLMVVKLCDCFDKVN